MINLINISKSYFLKKQKIPVLKKITLNLPDNGFIYLMGESGSGKSTLLNIIGGLDKFDSGQYLLNGQDVSDLSEKKWSIIRQNTFGIVFQNYNLIEHLSVRENIELSLDLGTKQQQDKDRQVEYVLDLVNMWDQRDYLPNQLSGGQKQRVAIARALINNPRIILADEPTGALDTKNAEQIMSILSKIARQGKLVLMVTHSEEFTEFADAIINLKDGKIKSITVENKHLYNQGLPPVNFKHKSHLSNSTIFKMALRNMKNKKKRTWLTAIGSAIGITGLLLIAFFSTGIKGYLDTEFNTFKTNNILMVNKKKNNLISQKEQKSFSKLKGIDKVITEYTFTANLKTKSKNIASAVSTLVPKENQNIYHKNDLKSGRYPTKDKEIMIPEKIAVKLFGSAKNALGQQFELVVQLMTRDELAPTMNTKVKIVGITKNKIISSLDQIFISHTLAQNLVNKNSPTKPASSVILITNSTEATKRAKTSIEKKGYYALTPKEDLESGKQIIDIIFIFLGLVAGISLIVAAIMIAIVIYVSVLERQKEIGILKTMGAQPRDVRRMFLTEGTFVGGLGGFLGIIASLIISVVLNIVLKNLLQIDVRLLQLNLTTILTFLIFSLFLGMITAIIPAQKAAKKKIVTTINS